MPATVRRRRQEACRACGRDLPFCRVRRRRTARAVARIFVRVEACGAHACLPKLRASARGGCGPPHLRAISVRLAAERRCIEPSGELQPFARKRLRAVALSRESVLGPKPAEERTRQMRAFAAGGFGPPIPNGIEPYGAIEKKAALDTERQRPAKNLKE